MKNPEPIANPELVAALSELRELVHDLGVTSCERSDNRWQFDPDEEDDRKPSLVFSRGGLNPENPVHRDLLLERFIDLVPISGAPAWSELDMRDLVRDVHYTVLGLKHLNEPSTRLDACKGLTKQPPSSLANRKYPGDHSAGTLLRRFYSALSFFRRRLPSSRFQRTWPTIALNELRSILRDQQKNVP